MVSDAVKKALENKTERVVKLIWEDGSTTELSDIAGESMSIEQVLCDGGGISYGQCNASKFKIKIKRENCAGTTFKARCYFTGLDECFELGKYTVDSAGKKDQRNFREIIAYDDMRKLQRDVSDWYNGLKLSENTITLAEMLKSLLTYCEISYNSAEIDSLVNAAVNIEETIAPSKLQGQQAAEKILEINGVFGTVDGTGTFRIVNMLNKAAEQIDQSRYYTCDYEEYTVKAVNALQLRGEEGDIGYVIEAPEGTVENGYIVTDNFLLYGKSGEELKVIGDNLFKMIKGLTYCPVKLSTRNITYLDLGAYIDIDTGDDIISSVIMKRTIKGIHVFKETLTSEGDEYFNYDIEGSNLEIEQLRGKTNLLSRTVEGTLSKVEEISKEMGTVSTTIQQLSGQIITEITEDGEVLSRFSQILGKFLFKGKWFGIYTDNVTLDGTTFKVDNGYIGGLRIGSEGLSSDDYITLQIFKDGTGKFTNLYADGQGHIELRKYENNNSIAPPQLITHNGYIRDVDDTWGTSTVMYSKQGTGVFGVGSIGEVKEDDYKYSGANGIHAGFVINRLRSETTRTPEIAIQGQLGPNGLAAFSMFNWKDLRFRNTVLKITDTASEKIAGLGEINFNYQMPLIEEVMKFAENKGYPVVFMAYGYSNKYIFFAKKRDTTRDTGIGVLIKEDSSGKNIYIGDTIVKTEYMFGCDILQITIEGANINTISCKVISKQFDNFLITGSTLSTQPVAVTPTFTNYTIYIFTQLTTANLRIRIVNSTGNSVYYTGVKNNGVIPILLGSKEVCKSYAYSINNGEKYAEDEVANGSDVDYLDELLEIDYDEARKYARAQICLEAGNNVTFTEKNGYLRIDATIPNEASEDEAGLISPSDKSKLDGIEAGADVNVQSDWNETSTGSDAFIKNKPTSLPASDVYEWAKQPNKPEYTAEEIGADASGTGAIVYDQAKKYADKVAADAAENKVDKVSGKGLSTNDLTATLKANYDAAYAHSQIAHAASDAEKNIIVSVKQNGTAITPDSNRAVNIVVPTKVSELSNDSGYLKEADIKDLSNKLDKTGDASNTTVKFTQAAVRSVLTAGEKMSVQFGKIAKWLADLKTVAFTGSFNDLIDKPTAYPPASHTHDDRYYTESEVDTKLNGKAASNHTHSQYLTSHQDISGKVDNTATGADSLLAKITNSWTAVPTDDTYFIRQDTSGANTFGRVKFSTLWSYVKGKADKVYAAISHTHDDRYYTESEIDTKLNGKSNSSHVHTNLDHVGRAAYVGSDADNSAGWYKVYSGTISGWNNNVARLSLMQGYAYINFGILDIHIRCNNTTAVVVHRLGWESRSGFQAGDACIVTGNNTWTLYIYNRNPRYGRIKVRVLDSMGTAGNWDMILVNNTTKESTTPAYNALSSDCATVNYANSAGNSAKVNNHTVEANVPANAKFTDTNTWRGIQNNLTSDSTTESLAAAQGKALNTRIDTIWEKLQAISGDHIFWEQTGIASSKINTYYGYYVRHGQIVVYAGTFHGGGSTSTSPTQIITGLPAPIAWTALSVMVNGNDNANHDAYLDTDGSIYMKNITGMQVFISGAYICST